METERAFQALTRSVHGIENNVEWLELFGGVRCSGIYIAKTRRLELNKGLEHLVSNLTFSVLSYLAINFWHNQKKRNKISH